MSNEILILLGTHDEYIYTALFDPDSKTVRKGPTTKTEPHPSWLTRHPKLSNIVYSNSWSAGKLFVLQLSGHSGEFQVMDHVTTGGVGLNFMSILPDHSGLVGACYGSGSVIHVPLGPDGLFARDNSGNVQVSTHSLPRDLPPRVHRRQEAPHAHQIVIHNDEVIVPDLGNNVVWRLRFEDGKWELAGSVRGFEDGDGPRHAVLHPNGKHIYTLCELSSTLVVHPFSPPGPESADQDPQPISRHSILAPQDSDPSSNNDNGPKMLASEIILLPSQNGGKHLLVCTNRDTPRAEMDSIALFAVGDDGSVERTEQGWVDGVGRHLRGMLPDKSGRWVAVAGRDEGGLTIFERDVSETGLRLDKVAHLDVEQVVVPLWID